MPASARRFLAAFALVAVIASSAACGITSRVTSARAWSQAAVRTDGSNVVVNVSDASGRVRDVEFDPADAIPGGGVKAAPGKPNAVDVPWTAGACDATTDIAVASMGAALEITVTIQRDDSKPCEEIAILRTIRLSLDQPIAPGLVAVHQ
jgi:hypothetical protein